MSWVIEVFHWSGLWAKSSYDPSWSEPPLGYLNTLEDAMELCKKWHIEGHTGYRIRNIKTGDFIMTCIL